MSEKICAECGERVAGEANFCPYCKSTSFNPIVVANASGGGLIHRLFYWDYPEGCVLAKSKLLGISTFIILISMDLFSPYFAGMLVISIIIALLVFLIAFAGHKMSKKPTTNQIVNNSYGLAGDFYHLILYWQNKQTGEYVLSKTKIITLVVFLVFSFSSLTIAVPNLFAFVVFGLFFAIPAFLIGFIVHKLTNPNPTNGIKPVRKTKRIEPKAEVKKEPPVVVSKKETNEYESKLKELDKVFDKKEKTARSLVEKRFHPPQLTYTRFISIIDKSHDVFKTEVNDLSNMISLSSQYTPRIESEIGSKFDVLNSIVEKMDDLINELLISLDASNDEDVDDLVGDMENLISSIKDYD